MNENVNIERLTPLDLLMPGTYIGALLTFPISTTLCVESNLRLGFDKLIQGLPWLDGAVFRTIDRSNNKHGLEIRWTPGHSSSSFLDKGTLNESYDALAKTGMPPSVISSDTWPASLMIDETAYEIGVPVFAASFFRFAGEQGLGLCVCIHHNVVDATGFAEIISMWAKSIRNSSTTYIGHGKNRGERLSKALSPALQTVTNYSIEDLWQKRPEYSRTPPSLPTAFASCTSRLFRIPTQRVQNIKKIIGGHVAVPLTTNTLVTALIWSAVTCGRLQTNPELGERTSNLITAVDGRQRVGNSLHALDDPYFGNIIMYSLTKLCVAETAGASSEGIIERFAKICDAIHQSQRPSSIDSHHVAEAYTISESVANHRTIFPGWDLFNARDLTVTSWANLDFYGMDFGRDIGKPEFVRIPYTEADGVSVILPRKRLGSMTGPSEELLEVVLMLRDDAMRHLVEGQIIEKHIESLENSPEADGLD